MKRLLVSYCAALALVACGNDGDAPPPDPDVDPDPLDLQSTAEVGSLDELHERIISQRCSGQPGLCHNGQFEPNLSTPALMFSYLVNRPGLEASDRFRVKPGDPAASLFIDKIRNRNGVLSQMPLGAEPLEEVDIAAIEKWINDGALRSPGADPAPVLNNPPRRPEIGIFNNSGTRLDGTGPISITPGSTLVIRHTVQDFETADDAMPFRALILGLGDGTDIVLSPGAPEDPHIALTTFDAAGPQGRGDQLNYRFTWNVPAGPNIQVRNSTTKAITSVPISGLTVTPLVIYVDGSTPGIIALDFSTTTIGIQ